MSDQQDYQTKGPSGELPPPPQYSSLQPQQQYAADPQQQQQQYGGPGPAPPQPGYPPQTQPGYPPQTQPGYPPQTQPGYPPQTQAGYPAQPAYPAQAGYPSVPAGYGQTIQTLQYTTAPTAVVTQVKPNNYMGLAIFSCLCCFWPTAIIAIMKANEVDSAFYRGDQAGALYNSNLARKWSYISIGVGVAVEIVCFIFLIIYFVAIIGSAEAY